MESRMRCWLLVLHRLATREEELRLKRGRLSIIASISSLGSESMLVWSHISFLDSRGTGCFYLDL